MLTFGGDGGGTVVALKNLSLERIEAHGMLWVKELHDLIECKRL